MPSTLCHKHILGAGLLGVLLGFGPIGTARRSRSCIAASTCNALSTRSEICRLRYGRPQPKLFLPSSVSPPPSWCTIKRSAMKAFPSACSKTCRLAGNMVKAPA